MQMNNKKTKELVKELERHIPRNLRSYKLWAVRTRN